MKKLSLVLVAVGAASVLMFGACANKTMNDNKAKSEMTDDKMSDGMDGDMKDDKMSDGMNGDMKDGEMSDGMNDKMSDDKMSDSMDNKMTDDKMTDGMDSKMKDDKMMNDMKKYDMHSDKMKDGMKKDKMKNDAMKDDKMKTGKMKKSAMKKSDAMDKDEDVLTDMDGNAVSLSSFEGKKLYTKFWASWCSICLAGLEEIDELSAEDKDFEVITVVSPNERGEKSKEEFIEWFNTLGYKNVKVLFDENGSLIKKYGIAAYPTSLYINEDGSKTELKIGHNSNDVIKENIAKL